KSHVTTNRQQIQKSGHKSAANMPRKGKMTVKDACRRVRETWKAQQAFNRADVEFLRAEGELNDLLRKINDEKLTAEVNGTKRKRAAPKPTETTPAKKTKTEKDDAET